MRFRRRVLEQHDVAYLQCGQCQSLQTEPPYWLDEAYREHNLSNLDTGAAQRNLQNLAACWSIAKVLGVRNVLDVGGGDGLLPAVARLRDQLLRAGPLREADLRAGFRES